MWPSNCPLGYTTSSQPPTKCTNYPALGPNNISWTTSVITDFTRAPNFNSSTSRCTNCPNRSHNLIWIPYQVHQLPCLGSKHHLMDNQSDHQLHQGPKLQLQPKQVHQLPHWEPQPQLNPLTLHQRTYQGSKQHHIDHQSDHRLHQNPKLHLQPQQVQQLPQWGPKPAPNPILGAPTTLPWVQI